MVDIVFIQENRTVKEVRTAIIAPCCDSWGEEIGVEIKAIMNEDGSIKGVIPAKGGIKTAMVGCPFCWTEFNFTLTTVTIPEVPGG